jgi:thiopeptide-type bacteriocin biosynthesis protein
VYKHMDAAVVRAAIWRPEWRVEPWPELTGPQAAPARWRAWLERVWQIPEFSAAVRAASVDLAQRMDRIGAGQVVAEPDLRRAVLAVMRYLLRAATRATPFGLFAGVAPAHIGTTPALQVGGGHRAAARVDAGWMTTVIDHLEALDALRPRLAVRANDLAVQRDGYLVLEHRPGDAAGAGPAQVQIRATAPARAALNAARAAIGWPELVGKLAADFPTAPGQVIDALLVNLLAQRFLITNLRPAMTTPDPLAAVLHELETMAAAGSESEAEGLRAIRAALARHDAAPTTAAAAEERAGVRAVMTDLHPPVKPALAVDLRLDWELVVPETVAREAASAAGVLTRLAARPALSSGWSAWHARFLERYGPGAVVPVLDVVNAGTGIGYPSGYLGSTAPPTSGPLTERDRALLRLAHTAALRREREVVLDDATVDQLAVVAPDDAVQPSTELTLRVHASSLRALEQGDFTLHVVGVARAAGAITGRFLGILGADAQQRMIAQYTDLPAVHRGALLAQLSTVPLYTNTQNVARAPRATAFVISLGEYRDSSPEQIPVTDLAVTADATRLHVVSLSRRQPVHTLLLSAVDLAFHTHPLARFLLEAPVALAAPCVGFEWGAASALPFLPALRYGRTVISPARWVLASADMPGPAADWPRWDQALDEWRKQVMLSEQVYLGDGDQCMSLDMTELAHRMLIRTDLERAGKVLLRAAPAPDDLGWTGGRAHEIVLPLATAHQGVDPVRWPGEVVDRDHSRLPGEGGRFSLNLYAHRDQQNAILTRYLPLLLEELDTRWWFVRYRDPQDHLRLRLAVAPDGVGPAVELIGAWTRRLRRAGLIARVSWETYFPESARFGGADAMDAAEAFFAADSVAAVAELAAATGKTIGLDVRAVISASLVDLAVGLIGNEAAAMRWLIERTRPDSTPPPRVLYRQAVDLANAEGDAVSTSVAASWSARRAALADYRGALQRAGTLEPAQLLPDLLHLHQARITGPDLAQERLSLHLARAAALSRTARTARAARS